MHKPEAAGAVLLLFATKRVAPFVSHFSALGYDVTQLSLGQDTEPHDGTGSTSVFLTAALDLEKLAADLRERLLRPQIVIHDVDRDVLDPAIEGEGPDWRVDPSSTGQIKTETLNWILERLDRPEGTLWVNVFAGEHAGDAPVYCSGRYGLGGFEAAVHMASRLRSLRILNLCVTYFTESTGGARRCPHCLTASHASAIHELGGDLVAAARYVERRYRDLSVDS